MRRTTRVLGGGLVMLGLTAIGGCSGETRTTDAGAGDAAVSCPAISGNWNATVTGCTATINPAQVTVDLTSSCSATFTSMVTKALPPVNGTAAIRGDGTFGPSMLTVGNEMLSCTGAPSGTTSAPTYTITCGACTVSLMPAE